MLGLLYNLRPMPKPRNDLIDRLQYIGLRVASMLMHCWPVDWTLKLGRPLDNRYVNDWLMGVRERQGGKIIAKKGATEEVSEILEKRGVIGFVADQNAGSKGIFVDFFGRKASTYKSIGLLAMEYNIPVAVGYARRVNDRFQVEVGVQDIIRPQDWANEPDPLGYITQRYTKAIEDFVRKDPGQYWWVHRRWKTRPKGEAPEQYD